MNDILIKLREDNRYTQTAMAKLLGISRQAYMKYETGEVEPPVEIIRKLKEIYGVSYEVLIDNRTDLVDPPKKNAVYGTSHEYIQTVASPTPAYCSSSNTKQTVPDFSLDEFATMLFSVAANLSTEKKLTTEQKLAKFEVYAKLAEAQIDIANGDKGIDAFTLLDELRGRHGK